MDTYKDVRCFRSRNAPGSISLMLSLHKDLKQTSTRQLKYDFGNITSRLLRQQDIKPKVDAIPRDSFSIFRICEMPSYPAS